MVCSGATDKARAGGMQRSERRSTEGQGESRRYVVGQAVCSGARDKASKAVGVAMLRCSIFHLDGRVRTTASICLPGSISLLGFQVVKSAS